MNEQLTQVVTTLSDRGLTDAAAGVILGAYLQQAPNATKEYKLKTLVAIFVLHMKKEKKQEDEVKQIVAMLNLSSEDVAQAAQTAMTLMERANNG